MFLTASLGPAQSAQAPVPSVEPRPTALKEGFWSKRQVKKAMIVGIVAVVAILAAALLFTPGAPLSIAGLVIAGIIASKLGVGTVVATTLGALGVALLPPALAWAIFGISKPSVIPQAPEIQMKDGNLEIDQVPYSLFGVYDKPEIRIQDKREWVTDGLRGHCPIFVDNDVFLTPKNSQRQDENYQKVVERVIEKLKDMPDNMSKGCVQNVTNFSQDAILASFFPNINLDDPPNDQMPVMKSRKDEKVGSRIMIQSEPLKVIQIREMEIVEWDTTKSEIVQKKVANIDVAYIYDPNSDQLAVYLHRF